MKKITSFELAPGRVLSGKFVVLSQLGAGSEGEVYKVKELHTNFYRAIKLFFPHRNPGLKISARYATKLNKLKHSPIVMDYISHEVLTPTTME